MHAPVLNAQVIHRLKKIDADYTIAQLQGMQEQPGNPCDAQIHRFESATAVMARQFPQPFFNRVLGLSPEAADSIADIVALYRDNRLRCRFDIVPSDFTPDLADRLAAHGLWQRGFRTILYTQPEISRSPLPDHIDIREVRSGEDFELFLHLYQTGTGCSEIHWPETRRNMATWLGRSGWHLYISHIHGEPAGTAVLFVSEGTGYLVSAATIPHQRGRGGQSALIRHRLTQAAEQHCDLVAAQTLVSSISQHNLQRAGLRIAYTKAIWMEPPTVS